MRQCYNKILAITVGVLASTSSYAQQQWLEKPLEYPLKMALEQNAELQIKELESSKTALEIGEVEAKRLPHVSAIGAYGYLNSTINLDISTHELPLTGLELFSGSQTVKNSSQLLVGGVSAQQVLFTGLQIPNGIKALEEKRKAQKWMQLAEKEKLVKEIIATFDQLMLLKHVDVLIEDSERRLEKEHKKVLKAIDLGLAIPYDREKLKLAMLELEEKKVEVSGNRTLLLSKLQQLTHISSQELEEIEYELAELKVEDVPLSADNRSELQALKAGINAQEYVLKKEKGARMPTVFAFGSANYINAFNSNITIKDAPIAGDVALKSNHLRLAPNFLVGIGAKWNIFDGGEQRKKIQKAEIDHQISIKKTQDTKDKLELLLDKNKTDYILSRQKLKVGQQQIKISENNLRLASKQFESGLIDLTERLAMENEYYKVSLNYFNQILNQRRSSIELLHASGILLEKIFNNEENK